MLRVRRWVDAADRALLVEQEPSNRAHRGGGCLAGPRSFASSRTTTGRLSPGRSGRTTAPDRPGLKRP
eukprot:591171-Prorocentrum_lima.AAC.1